jgi:hypothetical protein
MRSYLLLSSFLHTCITRLNYCAALPGVYMSKYTTRISGLASFFSLFLNSPDNSTDYTFGILDSIQPSLQPNNLSLYTLRLVIHMQQPNTTPLLPSPVSRAPRIKQK